MAINYAGLVGKSNSLKLTVNGFLELAPFGSPVLQLF